MSRRDFERKTLKLTELSLWRDNPRLLYTQADEMACIAKMMEDSKFLVLLEDIAKNGLGISPIVALKIGEEFVVMDGNRRTASLKLLEDPNLCPSELSGTRDRIASLSQNNNGSVLTEVECLVTDNREAVMQYILTTHTGEQGGAGQVDWNALMQVVFGTAENMSVNYKPAYRLLRLAQSHGYKFSDDYPISTLGRFAIKEFCDDFGIEYPSDTTKPLRVVGDDPCAIAALIEFISDIGEGYINVSTVDENSARGSAFREKYIKALYEKHFKVTTGGDNSPGTGTGTSDGDKPLGTSEPGGNYDKDKGGAGSSGTGTGGSDTDPTPKPSPKPTPKPTWQRDKFIPARRHTKVPKAYVKEYNVFVDMTKLRSKDTPISCVVMLRVLFEATLKKAFKALNINWHSKGLAKNTEIAAEQMLKLGRIDKPLRDAIVKLSGKDQGVSETFFSVDTIQSILHSQHYHPTRDDVNIFWDNMDLFIARCWDMVESSDKEKA